MNIALLADTCTAADPNADLCGNRYMGDDFQGMAAGMWATMPEWARVGLCVIIAALLITAIVKIFSALFARAAGVVIVIVGVVLLHNKIPGVYDWFRHLPFVNGTL